MSQSLAELGWRTFNFFNLVPVQDPTDPTKKATILQGINITCWSSGDGFVLFGESRGAIFQLYRNLEIQFFKAFKQRLIHFTHAQNLLIAVGEDNESDQQAGSSSAPATPILKIWDLDQWEEGVAPKCRQTIPLNLGRKFDLSKICSVAVDQDLSILVVGLSNNSLFYALTELQRDFSTPKFRMLRDGTTSSLGGDQLVGVVATSINGRKIVSCIAEKSLHSYILGGETILHDAKGCDRNCWYFTKETNQLIVAGREMVYFYNLADCLEMGGENGRCHALGRGSDKVQLIEQDGMVALLTEQDAHIQSTSSKSSRMTMLNIYDIEQRYIAFFCSMPSPCHLFLLDSTIYLLNADGVLNRLVEESLDTKLDILMRKNLFDLAISIARRSPVSSEEQCNGIFTRYGDYLYTKGDFDNAIKQYIETIGHVEPSKIIKKFLDGPRIPQLCSYLEVLHQRGVAIGQHTTLLLIAYVKLNAVQKLTDFIEQNEAHLAHEAFDADAAIKLLRSAQLYRVAAKLALKCQKPEVFVDILCQDTKEWANALRFIEKLPVAKSCAFLEMYGPMLLENMEQETLRVIRQVIMSKEANLKELVKMLMSRPARMEELFSELNAAGQLQDPQLRNTLLEQRLKQLPPDGKLSKAQLDELLELVGPDNFEQALLLECRHKCPPLAVHILRSQNKKDELLQYLLREGDVLEALDLCGDKALQDMWIDLIAHVSSSQKKNKKENLLALLKRVSQSDVLHPLVVLELLSSDDSLQVGDIRDYVVGWLERQNGAIRANEANMVEQEKRLAEMNAEIEDLEKDVQVFQVSKCAVCNNALQVPAVHFYCRHSYHANCFESYSGNSPDQCPACLVSARKRAALTEAEEEKADSPAKNPFEMPSPKQQQQPASYQQFKNELANTTDVMALISDYIASHGAFNPIAASSNSTKKSSTNASSSAKAKQQSTNPFEDD